MGRPTALTEERREQIEAKLAQGVALVVVAEETGVSAEYGDHEDVPAPGAGTVFREEAERLEVRLLGGPERVESSTQLA